jgi:hypothetical protein
VPFSGELNFKNSVIFMGHMIFTSIDLVNEYFNAGNIFKALTIACKPDATENRGGALKIR